LNIEKIPAGKLNGTKREPKYEPCSPCHAYTSDRVILPQATPASITVVNSFYINYAPYTKIVRK